MLRRDPDARVPGGSEGGQRGQAPPFPPPRRALPVPGAEEIASSSLPGCPCLREERAGVQLPSNHTSEER